MSRLRYPFTEISARCRLCGAEGLTASSEHALGGRLIDWRRSHAPVCPEWPRWAEKKGLRLDQRGALLYPNETGPYEPRIRSKPDEEDEEATEAAAPSAEDGLAATADAATTDAVRMAAEAAAAIAEDGLAATTDAAADDADEDRAPSADLAPPDDLAASPQRGAVDAEPAPLAALVEAEDTVLALNADDLDADALNAEAPTDERPLLAAPAAPLGAKTKKSPTPVEPQVDLMRVPAEHLQQAELF
ncbi:MAG TPA: hypothetical protein VGE94_01990 [Chloroflexota bacterium]